MSFHFLGISQFCYSPLSMKVKSDNKALSLKSQKPPQLGLFTSNLTKASPLFFFKSTFYVKVPCVQMNYSRGQQTRLECPTCPYFCNTRELRMDFTFFNPLKKIKRILLCNTWKKNHMKFKSQCLADKGLLPNQACSLVCASGTALQ